MLRYLKNEQEAEFRPIICKKNRIDVHTIKKINYTSNTTRNTFNYPLIDVASIVVADISTRNRRPMIKRFFACAQNDIQVTGY